MLQRQLLSCTRALHEEQSTQQSQGNDFLAHINSSSSESDAIEILDLCSQAWMTNASDGSAINPLSSMPSELLRVSLAIPRISDQALLKCLSCINESYITGRSAIYCVSEIRLFISSIHCSDMHDAHKTMKMLNNVLHVCISSFLISSGEKEQQDGEEDGMQVVDSLSLHTSKNTTVHMKYYPFVLLELLPNLLSCMYSLRNRFADAVFKPYEKLFLDNILGKTATWSDGGTVALMNALCEMYLYMDRKQLSCLEKRILQYTSPARGFTFEKDVITGILRACLRLMEQSRDERWVHLLRNVYRKAPVTESQTIEVLMEQVLSLSPMACMMIRATLEDAAVNTLKQCSTKKTNGVMDITVDDLRLILLLSRSSTTVEGPLSSHTGAMLDMPLPNNLKSGEKDPMYSLLLARTFLLLVLVLMASLASERESETGEAALRDISKSILGLRGTSTTTTTSSLPSLPTTTTTTSSVYSSISTSAHNACEALQLWIHEFRGGEILRLCSYLCTYPDVTSICVKLLPHCLVSSTRIISQLVLSVYEHVPSIRSVVLSLVLRGLLCSGKNRSHQDLERGSQTIIKNRRHNTVASTSYNTQSMGISACFLMQDPQSAHCIGWSEMPREGKKMTVARQIEYAGDVFIHILTQICTQHTSSLITSGITSLFQVYVPILSTLPLHILSPALLPLAQVCGGLEEVLSCVLMTFRKMLMHKEVERRCFAIRILCALLPSSTERTQLEAIYALTNAISLSLECRRVLYAEFLRLITAQIQHGNTSNSGGNISTSSNGRMSDEALRAIGQWTADRLNLVFATSESNGESDREKEGVVNMVHLKHEKGKEGRGVMNRSSIGDSKTLTYFPALNIEQYTSLSGQHCALNEDTGLLLALVWIVDAALDRERALRAAIQTSATLAILLVMRPQQTSTSPVSSQRGEKEEEGEEEEEGSSYCYQSSAHPSSLSYSLEYLSGIASFLSLGCPYNSPGAAVAFEEQTSLKGAYIACVYNTLSGVMHCMYFALMHLCKESQESASSTNTNKNSSSTADQKGLLAGCVSIKMVCDMLLEYRISLPTASRASSNAVGDETTNKNKQSFGNLGNDIGGVLEQENDSNFNTAAPITAMQMEALLPVDITAASKEGHASLKSFVSRCFTTSVSSNESDKHTPSVLVGDCLCGGGLGAGDLQVAYTAIEASLSYFDQDSRNDDIDREHDMSSVLLSMRLGALGSACHEVYRACEAIMSHKDRHCHSNRENRSTLFKILLKLKQVYNTVASSSREDQYIEQGMRDWETRLEMKKKRISGREAATSGLQDPFSHHSTHSNYSTDSDEDEDEEGVMERLIARVDEEEACEHNKDRLCRLIHRLPASWQSTLDRWDVYISPYSASIRSSAKRFLSEYKKERNTVRDKNSAAHRSAARETREAIRSTLFAVRGEVLRALVAAVHSLTMLNSQGDSNGNTSGNDDDKDVDISHRLHLSNYFAREFEVTSAIGLSKGVCMAYLTLLQCLTRGLPAPSSRAYSTAANTMRNPRYSYVAITSLPFMSAYSLSPRATDTNTDMDDNGKKENRDDEMVMSAGDKEVELATGCLFIATVLWEVLPRLSTTQTTVLAPMIRLAVRLSGPHYGLQCLYEAMQAVGRGCAGGGTRYVSGEGTNALLALYSSDNTNGSTEKQSKKREDKQRRSASNGMSLRKKKRKSLSEFLYDDDDNDDSNSEEEGNDVDEYVEAGKDSNINSAGAGARRLVIGGDNVEEVLLQGDETKLVLNPAHDDGVTTTTTTSSHRKWINAAAQQVLLNEAFKILQETLKWCLSSDYRMHFPITTTSSFTALQHAGDISTRLHHKEEMEREFVSRISTFATLSSVHSLPSLIESESEGGGGQGGIEFLTGVSLVLFSFFQPLAPSAEVSEELSPASELVPTMPLSLEILLDSPSLSLQKKAHVLSACSKFVSQCTKECNRLLKTVVRELRLQELKLQQMEKEWQSKNLALLFDESATEEADGKSKGDKRRRGRNRQKRREGAGSEDDGEQHEDIVTMKKTAPSLQPKTEKRRVAVMSTERFDFLLCLFEHLTPFVIVQMCRWIRVFSTHFENIHSLDSNDKSKKSAFKLSAHGLNGVAKQTQNLSYRIDQFIWQVKQILNELDKPRKVYKTSNGSSSSTSSSRTESESDSKDSNSVGIFALQDTLKQPLLATDEFGRVLLDHLREEEMLGMADEGEPLEEEREDADDDDDADADADWMDETIDDYYDNFDKVDRHNGSRKEKDKGKRSRSSLESLTNAKGRFASQMGQGSKKASKKSRLRSRNRVVDQWLQDEGGGDAYADLEDFLV